jgi:hypothetical protein
MFGFTTTVGAFALLSSFALADNLFAGCYAFPSKHCDGTDISTRFENLECPLLGMFPRPYNVKILIK